MEAPSDASLATWLTYLLSESTDTAQERARTTFDREVEAFDNRFVLFGAGNMGRRVLAQLRHDGIAPLVFADNHGAKWGKTIDGLDVLPPKEAAARYGGNAAFIVTIYNHRHSFPETRNQLLRLGCKKVVSVIPFRWKYSNSFLPYYRDDLPEKVLLQREEIRAAYALWSDERSRREFVAQVAWRLNGDFDILGAPDPKQQYFPGDIIRHRVDETFVDVGAYDGDSLRIFLSRQHGDFRRAIALEPDRDNFRRLVQYLAELPTDLATKIEARELAASNRAGRLRFTSGEGTSAALSDQGSTDVECVMLDTLLEGEHPTYVKMDIEGAELDAIEGCKHVLAFDQPVLAACVYHAQDHLWRIPLSVHRISSKYHFFLRPHLAECWETVCYAVPPDRRR